MIGSPAKARSSIPNTVNVTEWVRRSNSTGAKPILNFEQFWNDAFLIRLFDGPTPKRRRDFHINTTAEFFFQLQGDLTCTMYQDGEFVTRVCHEGEMLWVPPLVPHLNEREEGSIGLVIHGQREPHSREAMVWYCPECQAQVHRVDYEYDDNLQAWLAPRIREFLTSEALRTCPKCSCVMSDDLGFM